MNRKSGGVIPSLFHLTGIIFFLVYLILKNEMIHHVCVVFFALSGVSFLLMCMFIKYNSGINQQPFLKYQPYLK